MKKIIVISIVAVLMVIATVTTVMLLKHEDTPPADTEIVSVIDDCWEHVTNMNVEELDDGAVEVTLTAPDYASLVKMLATENKGDPTSELIAKAVKNNPETVKEYTFTAASSEETDIKNALMEQISYELVALTLVDMIGG